MGVSLLRPPSFPHSSTFFFICVIQKYVAQCTILAHFILGAKLTIQNEISKLPMQSLNPDHDNEKPLSIISEASSSSIETIISTHTGILEYFNIKE